MHLITYPIYFPAGNTFYVHLENIFQSILETNLIGYFKNIL